MARTLTGEALEAANALRTTQAHYVLTLGVYQQASAEAAALWETVPADADDATFADAFARIESMAPTTTLYDALRIAEDRMVNAARRLATIDPATARRYASNRATLENMFTSYRRYPTIAAKLIKACAALDPFK